MAHIGQELGFGFGGRFSSLLGLLQILLSAFSLCHLRYAHGQQAIALIKDHLLADEHQYDEKAEGCGDRVVVGLAQGFLSQTKSRNTAPIPRKGRLWVQPALLLWESSGGLVSIQMRGIYMKDGCQAHEQAATSTSRYPESCRRQRSPPGSEYKNIKSD